MDGSTVTTIILSVAGFIIVFLLTTLVGIAKNFVLETKKQTDSLAREVKEQNQKVADEMARSREVTTKLTNGIDKLTDSLEATRKETIVHYADLKSRIDEQHEQIEMLRDRTHDNANHLQILRLKGEAAKLWDFKGDPWDMPGLSKKER